MKTTRLALSFTLLSGLMAAAPVMAQSAGDVLVRGRIEKLNPANESDAFGAVPANAVTLNSKTIPEVDITYFFSPNLAAELVLTVPQKHDVYLSGSKIGSLKHLPPTLSLQYHFTNDSAFKPYLGLGVNYTRISSVELPAGLSLGKSSVGLALGAGVDYKISPKLYLNFDVKKIGISTDLKSGGSKVSEVKVDPWLYGVGIGYVF